MGTRRSRHNKGRKPLYKFFDTETVRHWGEDGIIPPKWIEDEYEDQSWRDVVLPPLPARRSYQQSEKAIELLPVVRRYLEKRRSEDARRAANELFPTLVAGPARVISDDEFTQATGSLHASEHDVLMQFFVDRKISIGKMQAGRRWQRMREDATIQPCVTIDWSQSPRLGPYQKRGDLRDKQIGAMEYRRHFLAFAGPAIYAFADFCLEPDRGIADLTRLLRIDEKQLTRVISDLLEKMCVYASSESIAA